MNTVILILWISLVVLTPNKEQAIFCEKNPTVCSSETKLTYDKKETKYD